MFITKVSKKIKIYDHLGQHIKDVALKLENRQKVLGMGVDSKKNIYLMTYPTKIIIVDVNGVVNQINRLISNSGKPQRQNSLCSNHLVFFM